MSNQTYASAARTATLVGDDNKKVSGNHGCKVTIDVTAVPGIETTQLIIEGKAPASGKYYTILQEAASAAVRTVTLTVQPGGAITANVSANDSLTDNYRIRVAHSASGSHTYSVSVTELQ